MAEKAGVRGRGDAAARDMRGEAPEEFRGCTSKKRYPSRVEAKKAAATASRRKDAPSIYVYECPYCQGWHLTHRKPRG